MVRKMFKVSRVLAQGSTRFESTAAVASRFMVNLVGLLHVDLYLSRKILEKQGSRRPTTLKLGSFAL